MNLAQIPDGVDIFVDASILSFYFTNHPDLGPICKAFLNRCAGERLHAYTSVIAAGETIHRVIVAEAVRRFALEPRRAVTYLKQHPARVRELREHLGMASAIYQLGVDILPVTYVDLHASKAVRSNYGLLTNDSLIVAVMRREGLVHLATHDRDFERVDGLKVWMPFG